MLRSEMSIIGLYNYDNSIFKDFKVPEELDKDLAITEILAQCGELELLYADYDIMKMLIGTWTKSEFPQWVRVYENMTARYNPLWNVDGSETETITRELSGSRTENRENNISENGSASTREDGTTTETGSTSESGSASGETSGITTKSVQGFNSNDWADAEKIVDENSTSSQNEANGTSSKNGTTNMTGSATNQNNVSEDGQTTGSNTERETITTEKTRGGNIGVTMSTQLLEADLEYLLKVNPYQWIVDSFKRRFCLLVY